MADDNYSGDYVDYAPPEDYTPAPDYSYSAGDSGGADFSSLYYDPASYEGAAQESVAPSPDYDYSKGPEGGADLSQVGAPQPQGGGALTSIWHALSQMTGLSSKDKKTGQDTGIDLSNPKTLANMIKLGVAVPSIWHLLSGGDKPTGQMTPDQMRAAVNSPYTQWSPQQRSTFDAYMGSAPNALPTRQRVYATSAPIVPGRGYAGGGNVHGPLALVRGGGGGQEDNVDAKLSPGEYVWDADTVAALGDGNNEHGAAVLDQMRENIRAHKRSAPADSIPPKAHPVHQYLPKGALSRVKRG